MELPIARPRRRSGAERPARRGARGAGTTTDVTEGGLHRTLVSSPLRSSTDRAEHHTPPFTALLEMVLPKPANKHVLKAFDLTGKVAAVTGR